MTCNWQYSSSVTGMSVGEAQRSQPLKISMSESLSEMNEISVQICEICYQTRLVHICPSKLWWTSFSFTPFSEGPDSCSASLISLSLFQP